MEAPFMRCRRKHATQRDRLYRGCYTVLCLPAAGPLVGPAVALGGDACGDSGRISAGAPFGRGANPGLDLGERPRVQAILNRIERDAARVFHRVAAADRRELRERPRTVGETPRFFQVSAG